MALYLILTSEIADQVREQLASAAPVYVPIQRTGDVFILPSSVMEAESHADAWPALVECPQLEPGDSEFPSPLAVEE